VSGTDTSRARSARTVRSCGATRCTRRASFFHVGDDHFRANQLRRRVIDKATGNQVGDELVRENCALVKYVPTAVDIIELAA
jgi:vancomycin resistance protein VanW